MKNNIIAYLKHHHTASMNQLAEGLGVSSSVDFAALVKTVSKLEHRHQLEFDAAGMISLPPKKQSEKITLKGTFHAHKNGFGFVSIEEGVEDLFVNRRDVGLAIDGDVVEVAIVKVADRLKGTAAEARVVDVLEHGLKTAVGLLILDDEKPDYAGYIQSKNQKISQRIYVKKSSLVLTGTEILKVDIQHYPSKKRDYFVATVRAVVGHQDDVGIDVLEVLESMEIVSKFPEDVLAEANQVPDRPSEKEMAGRRDLRQEITFTIDGADAKDLDDAVHIKRLKNGHFELGVHIADVSHYVTEGSALDREALSRGTSVYVTDRVVPMLPERLSNGICSLNPAVNRLTQSAIMEIDQKGRVVSHWIGQTVIRTTFRMTYSDVNDMIAGNQEKLKQYQAIVSSVTDMVDLHTILEKMRHRRGALNFDTKESKIVVNAKGMPVDIVLRQRGIAERMIESFMLIANETVARQMAELELPFIYRIHEEPKSEKLQKLLDHASMFGLSLSGTASSMTSEALQEMMAKVADEPYADVLNKLLLRSMQQARYSEQNAGHYGLGASFYTHFTSPIRRYPDLLVHRLIREYAHLSDEKQDHFAQTIPEIASQTSRLERRAIDAERAVEAMKKAEFMQEFVGQEFDGVVSSVVKFGLFVELPNTVEGLVHVTTLPEFYNYNERTMALKGDKSGTVFHVGQAIRIRVERADKVTGEIDFTYLPSDLDVKEKVAKSSRKKQGHANRHRDDRSGRGKGKGHRKESSISSSKKEKKTVSKEIAKQGGSHGKGRRKSRRSK